jgi:hypothetical protein
LSKAYFKYKLDLGILASNTVQLDVSCSGFQIYSGLCGYKLGLLQTNFICSSEIDIVPKLDFYSYFLKYFLDNLNDVSSFEKYFPKLIFKVLFKFTENFIVKFFTRAFVKELLICFLYSEGDNSRIKKIELKLSYTNKQELWSLIKNYPDISLYTYLLFISKTFKNTFKIHFKEISSLKDFIESTLSRSSDISLRKGVNLSLGFSSNTFYTTLTDTIKSYSVRTSEGKTVKYNYTESTDKFNFKKVKSSLGPNFIHRLDAELVNSVVTYCIKNNIPIVTAHDSFYTFLCYENIIKEQYFIAFKNSILIKETLDSFIYSNDLNLYNSNLVLFNSFKEERKLIVRLIDDGSLVQSPNILNP